MNELIGTTVSHYRVIEQIGQGGMGVVYKAQDTKLDRLVALKFLPDRISTSDQDKARFVQEAKAAASLNHPNICTVYGIDEHEGMMFIAMEFVDGQTLRERQGTISPKQALDIGIQIADGLSAAHEKGIVHRDIKPENIMIRKDGIAQIMDFGLAKLRATGSVISRLTKEGSTVGTAGYMSPEQVQGHDTDHRSDIFSYGVLLYELFTGQLPFKGVHETALAYEIVNVDAAPMTTVKSDLDPSLDSIVLDCLEKDPKERCQSVAEVARDLRRVKRESTRQKHSRITAQRPAYSSTGSIPAGEPAPPVQEQPRGTSRVPWIVSALLFLVAAGAIAYHVLTLPPPVEKPVMRSIILSPRDNFYDVTWGGHISISPNGKTIAFVAIDTLGVNHLWSRQVNSMNAIELSGTEDARYPFWSTDSRKIGFFARGKMKSIEATGGPVLSICDAGDGRGGTWNQDGVIIFAPGPTEPLWKVSAAGGTPVQLTRFDTLHHESSHRWPLFLPDGKHFIYSTLTAIGTSSDADVVRIANLDTSVNKVLFTASSNVCYAGNHLLYIRQGTLMAQPFDPARLEFAGDAVPVAEQIIFSSPYGRGMFSVSQNGMLILQTGENQISHGAVFDLSGSRTHLLPDLNPNEPKFSPDGKRVAYYSIDPQNRNGDVWLHELARGASSRVTFNPALDIRPIWSPRGDSLAFSSNRAGVYDLFLKSANGTGDEVPLVQSNRNKQLTDWSIDGRYITYTSAGDPKTKADLWILPMFGDRKPVPFLQTEFNEGQGTISPDSRWIVYASDETGRFEIYARLLDGTGGKFQVSTNGGRRPIWKSDGRKIFISSIDRKLQVAYVNPGQTSFTVDSIRTLFDFESRSIVGNTISDVSSDGKQILAVVTESKQTAAPITLVVNWDEELKKK